jgi:plastocyanin
MPCSHRCLLLISALAVVLGFGAAACSLGSGRVPAYREASRPQPTRPEATSGSGASPSQTLDFVAVDIKYAQPPTQAAAGKTTIVLRNEGLSIHNVTLEGLGDKPVVEARGGQTAEAAITLTPGTYTYFCSIPGHRAAGMAGTLVVH